MSQIERNPTLTGTQVRAALALAGLQPEPMSPLGELGDGGAPSLAPADRQALVAAGWLEPRGAPRLKEEVAAGLRALCAPRVRASMLLGTRDSLLATQFYSAGAFAEGELASCISDPEGVEFGFAFGQSPSMLAQALTEQLLIGPLDAGVTLRAELEPDAFVALLAILDWRVHAALQSRLDRAPQPEPAFRPSAAWEALVEGRTAEDLDWQVTVFTYLLPFLDYGLDVEALQAALPALERQGLIAPAEDGRYALRDPLLELADALPPVLSFAGLNVELTDDAGNASSTHLAFVRGRSATLMVQPLQMEDGRRLVLVDSLDGVQLGDLLFSLGSPGQQIVGASRATPQPATPIEHEETIIEPVGWQLAVVRGPDAGLTIALGDRATMGRMAGNDIHLHDEQASRRHAVVERVGSGYRVVDLGSRNGTLVNGAPILEPTVLRSGDTIALGQTQLAVRRVGQQQVRCPSCGAEVAARLKFCTRCGAPLRASGGGQP